jgi:NADH oxidase (H2O2-forming)
MGESGGIKVNERMETSVHSIYAAGDCVDSIHLLTGKSTPSMLGSTATREGRVAGVNAVGGNLSISPLLNTTISDLDGVEVGSVGLNRALAKECGFSIVEAIFEGELLDPFLPSEGKIVVKMVGDKPSGKVIGVQILGEGRVWGRILATSFAMQKGITADELASAETAYVPSISPTFDPITITADLLSRKMKGEYEF